MSPAEFARLMGERPANEVIEKTHPKMGDAHWRASVHQEMSPDLFTLWEFHFRSDGWCFYARRNNRPSLATLQAI